MLRFGQFGKVLGQGYLILWRGEAENRDAVTRGCIKGKPALYPLCPQVIKGYHIKIQTTCCDCRTEQFAMAFLDHLYPWLPFGQHLGWCRPMLTWHVFVSNPSSTPGGYSRHTLYTSRDCSCLGSWRNLPGPLAETWLPLKLGIAISLRRFSNVFNVFPFQASVATFWEYRIHPIHRIIMNHP